ncbi:hypothetical protein BCR32DRAFT_294797 [Anaeromyces robustus]|uniref:Uncharacterized protein n=1 Tax=Anaeromyces robustus TaxID=1754192 RepID=A0A1Y1WZ34_9FUNG|nr:hypothetical protein BCR32DRAFT_294797 [Anaeromyces robustus]|eukprot:ORX78829.1 hypothetical protein BCR32DRAFT_294797 [Anaeromyces robustus]
MINIENYQPEPSSEKLKNSTYKPEPNSTLRNNTIKTLGKEQVQEQEQEQEIEDFSKYEKALNKDNPSDITLNINDFLEEQEQFIKIASTSSFPYQNIDNEENEYAIERKLKYPINNPDCPTYLRYMNILKNEYSNYSNNNLFHLYNFCKVHNTRIRRKDLLKIATVDGKFNYGIDF